MLPLPLPQSYESIIFLLSCPLRPPEQNAEKKKWSHVGNLLGITADFKIDQTLYPLVSSLS